jgi:hypothetical protein
MPTATVHLVEPPFVPVTRNRFALCANRRMPRTLLARFTRVVTAEVGIEEAVVHTDSDLSLLRDPSPYAVLD